MLFGFVLAAIVVLALAVYSRSEANTLAPAHIPVDIDCEDLDILSGIIYAECGVCDDFEKYLVGSVVINRMSDPRWPNTMKAVVEQEGQFHGLKSVRFEEKQACRDIAINLLGGIGVVPGIYYFCYGKVCDEMIPVATIQGKYHKFGQ